MEIRISKQLCQCIPQFQIGLIEYHGIKVEPSPQMLKGRLQFFQESIYFDLLEKDVSDFEGIKEWRTLFNTTGKDPNRYRHSAEALYRRIANQNYLQPVNSAIDLNNFFSLEYQVPLGIYDLDSLRGDIMIRLGSKGEEYMGLNGRINSLENLIISADDIGPFGSPFIDSERTLITEKTKNAVQIIYHRPSISKDNKSKMTESLMKMFVQIHGGNGTFNISEC